MTLSSQDCDKSADQTPGQRPDSVKRSSPSRITGRIDRLLQAVNFRMASRLGTVKQAALALGVSPGAVSRNIAIVEQVSSASLLRFCRSPGHEKAGVQLRLQQNCPVPGAAVGVSHP